VELGTDVNAYDADGRNLLFMAAGFGHAEIVKLLLELGANVHALDVAGGTPLHQAVAACSGVEIVKMLVDMMGDSVLTQDVYERTPLYYAERMRQEAVVSFLRKNAKNKQRLKSTIAHIVDPAAQAAAEAAAAAMAALLIAEEENKKQAPPSKQGNNSNKARTRMHRRKANLYEVDTGSIGYDEAIGSSVASSSGRRDDAGERDGVGMDEANPMEKSMHTMERRAMPLFLTMAVSTTTSVKVVLTVQRCSGWRIVASNVKRVLRTTW
jgi:ankyrin repeat protein